MHNTHNKLKPTKRIKLDFNSSETLKDIEVPRESKIFAKMYRQSRKRSDQLGKDIMLRFEDEIIYAFDHVIKDDKILIPELNPVTIFYLNALMSYRHSVSSKNELFKRSPSLKNMNIPVDPKLFGGFFCYSSNCLINLQATIESFANRQIQEDYKFIDKKGNVFKPPLVHKLNKTLPEIHGKHFKKVSKKEMFILERIIKLRNDIIHLRPIKDLTNTKYKEVYRKLLNFNFEDAILAVRNYINFYEAGLIEDCDCNNEFYYEIRSKSKEQKID